MPFAIQGKITGLKESIRSLDGLDKKLRTKILRKAVKAGAVELRKEMRSRVPVSRDETAPQLVHGLLRASMGEKIKIYRKGIAVAIVGPRSGFKKNRKTGQRERTGIGKRALRIATKKNLGQKAFIQNPTYYAHLAGPKRKPEYMKAAFQAARDRARDAMIATIQAGLAVGTTND